MHDEHDDDLTPAIEPRLGLESEEFLPIDEEADTDESEGENEELDDIGSDDEV
jgi:hypothetical protein